MKKLLFLSLLFLPTLLFSQTLKEFDLQEMSEQQIPVFVEHPNEAALIFYTAINGFTVESNTGGVVSTQSEGSKFTAFLKPERQILTLKAPGFIEKKMALENMSAKQAKFYRVNEQENTYTTETGFFKVQTQPEGALMKIEGFPTFKQWTPCELKDFKAGKYRINLTKPDYYPLDTLIEIRPGMKQNGLFILKSMYGTLSIMASLPVKVKVGNQTIDASTDLTNLRLRDGSYDLSVNDPRFDPYRETVFVESGKTKILDLPLVKRAGFLQIMHAEGFDVAVNGETRIKKPGTQLLEFFEGSYRAEIKRPGFQPVTFSFTIKKGDVINWEPVFTAVTVKVKLETDPAGAMVSLIRNGEEEPLGFTPLEEQIAVGDVEFLVKRDGYKDYQFKATLEEGKPFQRTINLVNPTLGNYKAISGIKYGSLEYNGFTYKTVVIGNQEWTIENLRTTRYNDGTSIPKITGTNDWANDRKGAYCAYDNDESKVASYGYLYNWHAVNTGKLAPKAGGWRVPTDADWTKLTDYVGSNAGRELRAKTGWSRNTGTDNFGFSALPGGYRNYYGYFNSFGGSGNWWSSSAYDTDDVWTRGMNYNSTDVLRNYDNNRFGFSVLLVRDM
ncbi:MAG: PEGA domain-containing protein [Bacteroidetes bacterium]|nr:PEGA domain-containing protein [Bacteroidota bacterium]